MADPAFAQVDKMTAFLRGLGKKVIEDARADIARAMKSETERTIAAQTDAYGEPWKPGTEGEQMLEGTQIETKIRGPKIMLRIVGYHARHHRGYARGGVKRGILPERGLMPPAMARAVKRVVEKRFLQAKGEL
jgi:hypothetical protein